jgi:tRNA pseudouridine55 synthase
VLPLAVREATKLVPFVEGGTKSYEGAIRLGTDTDSMDADGAVVRRHEGPLPDEAAVLEALTGFLGEIEQVPPMYSAVKRGGVPLYRLARQGKQVERDPKRVRIDRIELLKYAPPDVEIAVDCSAGTYVRALASVLGERLGCGAHLARLRRTRSGPFGAEQTVAASVLEREAEQGTLEGRLVPPVNVLGLPVVRLSGEAAQRVRHGGDVEAPDASLAPGSKLAALGPGGELVAVLEATPGRRLHPLRVLAVGRQD